METAISYIEKEQMTSGYTSVLWQAPDEDVSFWYSNLKSALEELKQVKPEATQLEKSNVLMKLRETLLDNSSSVTAPQGISVYPHNAIVFYWGILSIVLFGVGVIWTDEP